MWTLIGLKNRLSISPTVFSLWTPIIANDRGHELFYYTAMQVAFGTGELKPFSTSYSITKTDDSDYFFHDLCLPSCRSS